MVDVVRTDSHLDFYGESRNMARMSDILAVYAWVDPSTGYCQGICIFQWHLFLLPFWFLDVSKWDKLLTGMSDLLSPFVVLYEDDADAFWCFEMLLRRMVIHIYFKFCCLLVWFLCYSMHNMCPVPLQRENFQMEGPTGVMKQLQALWKIMEITDVELFEHLSTIGAESLHFAFRMLLVLFRRELSFEESLSMWEVWHLKTHVLSFFSCCSS